MARIQLDAMDQEETVRIERLQRLGLDRKRSRKDVVRVLRNNMVARPGRALRAAVYMPSILRRLEGYAEDESESGESEEAEIEDEAR
jgi:hypothetical protein